MSATKVGNSRRPRLPDNVRLARSGLHGYGLFAADFIAQETKIIEYVGQRVTKAQAWKIEEQRLAKLARGEDGAVYTFDISKRWDLDGDFPWNHARRVNHSCDGNCESLDFSGRIWLVARRDIAPGEELTFDYGFPFSEWRGHPCRCGTQECAGFIVNKGQRWRVRQILAREKTERARVK
ncbi:SET domain-containing protein [Oleiharenicola lentus]|uniref:SET domain-containing protein n=1 Tax=Oleiharenicola lentus TaxID=2508720 RepID=UPI003F67F512